MRTIWFRIGLPLFIATASQAAPSIPALEARIQTLEERLNQEKVEKEARNLVPTDEDAEIAKLQLQLQLPQPLGRNYSGLSPGMSRIYKSQPPFAIGGFADINFVSGQVGNNSQRMTTVARLNPYLAWRFSEGLLFNSGLSFVNAGSSSADGAARVEFAYLDILMGNESGIRVGHVIVPFGLSAYRFEPTLYPLVNRPRPEQVLVPGTWHENGILAYTRIGSVLLQGGVVTALDGAKFTNDSWIATGRQNGANAKASNSAYVMRAELLTEHTSFGLSLYGANTAQGDERLGRAQVLLGALHGELIFKRFQLKAFYAEGAVSDTDRIFERTSRAIGSRARGGYFIASYDVLSGLAPIAHSFLDARVAPGSRELPVFLAYEYDDVGAEPAIGQPRTSDLAVQRVSAGINYLPHPQVALKSAVVYEGRGSGANARIFELGVAAVF